MVSCLLEVHPHEYERLGTRSGRSGLKTLRVFDFDDTLVKTNSKVGVIELSKDTGVELTRYKITPAEYARFKTDVAPKYPEKNYKFDYSDFADVVDPKLIKHTFQILQNVVKKLREDVGIPAVILTARGNDANINIRSFLKSLDINIPVKTLDDSNPLAKSNWIKTTMIARGIPHVEFFDDSPLNIQAVAELRNDPKLQEKFGTDLRVRSRLVTA